MADKKIGNRYFRSGEALATDAIKLQVRLMKFIGPALESLPVIFAARQAGATDEQRQQSDAAAIRAIAAIFANADPEQVVSLIEDICGMGKISYDGKGAWDDIVVDQEFSGQQSRDLIPVVVFILQETLGDFFSGALASGSQAIKARG
jgi:hypothetical protein